MTSKHRPARLRLVWLVACAAILAQVLASSALAATPIYVRTDGDDIACNGEFDADSGSAPNCAVATIGKGVDLVDAGGTVHVRAGTFVLSSAVSLNKAVTVDGAGVGSTKVQVSGSGHRFTITAPDVTLSNLEIEKTDATNQNIVLVNASDATIADNLFRGQYALGDGEVTRALEIAGGHSGLSIDGNEIHSLRQPAYINGTTTGSVTDNYVHGTRGWVVDGDDLTFTGNTWGSGASANYVDIAILTGVSGTYYPDILALSSANNDAVVEDQRPATAVLTHVAVDAGASPGGDGTPTNPYQEIDPAVARAVSGGRIDVAAGAYNEDVNLDKTVSLFGDGAATTTVSGPMGGDGATLRVNAMDVLIDGFTITRDGNNTTDWNDPTLNFAGIAIQGAGKSMEVRNSILTGNRTAIDINDNDGAHIHNNVIDFNRTGLLLRNTTDDVILEENEITDNWTMGILFLDASGGSNSPVQSALDGTFFNNEISGNWYGGVVERQSGGSLPAPGTTNLKNFSGNWFGTAAPITSTLDSAEPGYASLIPTAYGGAASNPGGAPDILGPAVANIDYTPWLASGTDTEPGTMGFQGDFTELWVGVDGAQTQASGRVQEGVDSVSGSTVNLAAGTYEEQVEIDSDLTLKGVGPTSIIKSPTNLTAFFSTSSDNYPIVYIHDADDVTVQDLTVDGAGRGNSNYRFIGIGFHNAGGTVDSVEVTDVRDTPFSGSQHGVAIYAYNDDTVARSIDVIDSTVTGFQKTAVALNASGSTPLTVDVSGNTITGAGTTPTTAQNGIQVFADLATGTVDDNALSGIAYDGPSYVATTLLNYYGDLDITNNQVVDAQVGIYNIEGAGSLTGNTMSVVDAGDYSWGIIATDPPYAVPQPFDAELLGGGGGAASDAEVSGASALDGALAPMATLVVDVSNNTIVYNDANDGNRYGIEAAAGYDANDMDVTIDDNIVTGFETGIVWFQCEASCDTGTFVAMSASGNCLDGNVTGMESNVGYLQVDAEDNWWGDASGPYHVAENPGGLGAPAVGDIDVTPWAVTGCSQTGAWLNTRTGVLSPLQEAIDDALSGDTLQAVGPSPGGANAGTDGIRIDLNGQTVGAGSPAFTVSADDVTIAGPGTLDGGGDASPGILVQAGADNLIVDGVEITDWADGIQVEGDVTSFKLVSSWLHDNADAGLQIDGGVSLGGIVTIEGNLFKENGGNGIQNDGDTDPLPAEYNSWGDVDGPTDTGDAGDGVSGMVDYDPWTFAEMYLDMDPTTPPPDDETTVAVEEDESFDVTLELEAEKLYGLTFQIDYDDTMLTLDGIAFSAPWASACVDDGSAAGTIRYRCNLMTGPEWDGVLLATLSFTAEDNGGLTGDGPWTNYLDIAHMEADSSTAAIGGVKVFLNNAGYGAPSDPDRDITDTDDGEITITGLANYSTFVDLQGRANDSGATLSVFDQLTIAGSTELANGASASSGALSTAHLSPETLTVGSTYYLQVDRDLYLPTTADAATDYAHSALLDTRPFTSLGNVVLLGGDAYNDNMIDVSDATCIGGAYGTAASTCGGGSPAGSSPDVNEDGIVDILDLVLMGGNYTLTASPWTP